MNLQRKIFLLLLLLSLYSRMIAQHEGHKMNKDSNDHSGMNHETMNNVSHAFSLNLPMNRNGSGSAWLPDNSPMYGYMMHTQKWMHMFHGNIFIRYNRQDIGNKGTRGDGKFDAPNWFMGMGQRKIGNKGLFRYSVMMSLDPLTVGGEGYPLLFQSGETWNGVPLVDRQHPHDLFSELSVAYTHMISEDADLFVYLAYPGEPAFGPVAFMHRVSSLYNPEAPISHHWQDATHITFGVATAGFRFRQFKLDISSFTGREPNEERYGFDKPRFDSWSARLSYNPSPAWALQVSQARVNDIHEFGPREDQNKTTASAIHSLRLSENTFLNTSAVWGRNADVAEHHMASNSILIESAYAINRTTIYGKYEWVQKSTEDLLLDETIFDPENLYSINSISLGIQQRILNISKTNLALGIQASLNMTSDELTSIYGKNPYSGQIYLRIYPDLMR
jgi:hypothetical protein